MTDGQGTAPIRWTDEERDPGLAAERTKLAWSRSTMTILACGGAVAKGVPNVTGHGRPVVGVSMLVLGAVVWLSGIPFSRGRHAVGNDRRAATSHELLPLAVGTALVGVAGLAIAVLVPG